MDKIDLALKDFLEKGKFVKTRTTLSAETPSTEDLCRFIRDELDSTTSRKPEIVQRGEILRCGDSNK